MTGLRTSNAIYAEMGTGQCSKISLLRNKGNKIHTVRFFLIPHNCFKEQCRELHCGFPARRRLNYERVVLLSCIYLVSLLQKKIRIVLFQQ